MEQTLEYKERFVDDLTSVNATTVVKQEIAEALRHLLYVSLNSTLKDGTFSDPQEVLSRIRSAYCHTQVAMVAASGCTAWRKMGDEP